MAELSTKLVHAGEERVRGAVSMPVFQSANYVDPPDTGYHDLRYIRLNNVPNQVSAAAKLAAVEGGAAGLVTGSGMAAISTTLLTLLSSGEHLLLSDCVYGGTHTLTRGMLRRLGIHADPVGGEPDAWARLLRPNTRLFYTEAWTNPLLDVPDHEAIVAFCRQHELVSVVDATMASPINFRPLELGYDLVLHSATKYLNGHSDIVAGAVVGSAELVGRVKEGLDHLGGSLDPHAAALLCRGLKTLEVRVHRQNQTALGLARFLESRPSVARVRYPGLPSHPQHERAKRLFDGFGGVFSFELHGGAERADRLLAGLRLPLLAPSFGGTESLATRPVASSHRGLSPQERAAIGLSDGLIRYSVGLEALGDLQADVAQALDAAGLA